MRGLTVTWSLDLGFRVAFSGSHRTIPTCSSSRGGGPLRRICLPGLSLLLYCTKDVGSAMTNQGLTSWLSFLGQSFVSTTCLQSSDFISWNHCLRPYFQACR